MGNVHPQIEEPLPVLEQLAAWLAELNTGDWAVLACRVADYLERNGHHTAAKEYGVIANALAELETTDWTEVAARMADFLERIDDPDAERLAHHVLSGIGPVPKIPRPEKGPR